MTQTARLIRLSLATVVIAALPGCSVSNDPDPLTGAENTSGSTANPPETDDDGTVPPATDVVEAPEDEWSALVNASLEEPPVVVRAHLDPITSASVLIPAATGGTISLEMSNESTATLEIPPGALDRDTTITLVEVTALGLGESQYTGVEVLPEGLVFPSDATPMLSLRGLGAADHAVAWDADDILERSTIIDSDDGSVTIPMFHFSGAGVGSAGSPLPTSEVDRVLDEVRRRLAEATASGDKVMLDEAITASITDLEALARGYQRAALSAAGKGCHVYQPVIDQLRIQAIGAMIGADVHVNDDAVGAVLVRSAECALEECRSGDLGAAGRFAKAAAHISAGVGNVDAATTSTIADALVDGTLLDCAQFDVTILGRSDFGYGEIAISEGVESRGLVAAGQSGSALRMDITARGWEKVTATMINMLGEGGEALLGFDYPDEFAACDPPTYLPGAMATTVTTAPGVDPGTLLPVLTLRPLMADSPLVCNGQTDPNLLVPDPMLLALLSIMPGIVFDGQGATHYFDESEQSGLLSWTASLSVDTAVIGTAGSAELTLQVRASSQQPETTNVDTGGLTDLFAELGG